MMRANYRYKYCWRGWCGALGLAGFIVIVLLPLGALAISLAGSLLSLGDNPDSVSFGFTVRQLGLLTRTLVFSAVVSCATVIIGVLAASVMWQWQKAPGVWLRWLVLPLMTIPPYIHAAAWNKAFEAGSSILAGHQVYAVQLKGFLGAGFVEMMAYLPVATGLALLGLASVSPGLIEAALVQRSGMATFLRIILPLGLPQIFAGGSVVFILSMSDYSIPSLFQQNTYALELFVQYSLGRSPSISLVYALPLLVIACAILYIAMGGLRQAALAPIGTSGPTSRLTWPSWLRKLQLAALVVLIAQVVVPLISLTLGAESWSKLLTSVLAARSELTTSLGVALAAGIACLPLAYMMAVQLAKPGKARIIWWILVILPLTVPAPMIGIGLIEVWNSPLTGEIYGSIAMPILAALSRFTSFAALVLLAYNKRLDPLLFDAAKVFQRSYAHAWLRINLPLISPGLAAAGCVVAALSLGELGATLIVAPPTRATLTMRIYNYMHYGASSSVAGLCLVLLGVVLLLGALSAWGFSRRHLARPRQAGEMR